MKLNYWNMYVEQIPRLWTGKMLDDGGVKKLWKPSQVIRVVGHQHSFSCLRYIYQIASENLDHVFMVFSNDIVAFEEIEFPHNVIPVLQADSRRSYCFMIDNYIRMCKERGVETPTLSMFCNQTIEISRNIKWLLLSGMHEKYIQNNIRVNYEKRRNRIPLYVEKLQYSSTLPASVNLRELPTQLAAELKPLYVPKDIVDVNTVAVAA